MFTSTPNGASNRFAQHVNRIQSPKPSTNTTKPTASPLRPRAFQVASEKPNAPGGQSQDSGYYGSQDVYSQETRVDNDMFTQSFVDPSPQPKTITTVPLKHSPPHAVPAESPNNTFQNIKEQQTMRVSADASTRAASPRHAEVATEHDARDEIMEEAPAPQQDSASQQNDDASPSPGALDVDERDFAEPMDGPFDEARSNSDGSSPIRPMVRKSSLNFASLPAREPLTGGKSLGGRASRTSHLDLNRKSYYGRQTDGKSVGNHVRRDEDEDDENEDAERVGLGAQLLNQGSDDRVNTALNHNRTYTQRLQDQINLLGKSKPSRPSKSLHNVASLQQAQEPSQPQQLPKSPASKPLEATQTTPGAFPTDEDEEDDWVETQQPSAAPVETQSPRPTLPKSHTADIMEGIHQSGRVSGAEFAAPTHDRLGQSASPQRTQAQTTASFGHSKSASVATMPAISRQLEQETLPLTKAVSVSNPALAAVTETARPQTPSKSPSRGFRDSPLKQVKNKLSSILKSSKGLLASSAAISAEGKTSMLSPSTTRLAHHHAPSSESLVSRLRFDTKKPSPEGQSGPDDNKTLPVSRRTRASTEREKEEKRLEKEAKRMEQQEGKLEKAREKEREKARVFSKEQEKLTAMEQQMSTKKTEETIPVKETPKPTRSSPRKIQRAPEGTAKPATQDVDMTDAPALAPPSVPRTAGPSQIARSKETTRPIKPTREPQLKPKQAPTVIRVKPGSQHSQYHSTSNGSNATVETSAAPVPQPTPQTASKASKATLQNKPSTQSLKGASSASRPKALDLAAKKKEQDEREAQRRREAKAEVEKKRAAAQEEQRKQEQRRLEAERQKQKDREQAAAKAEARQSANRQAMIEKAKQTRPPPPPVRSQPNGPPDYGHLSQDQFDTSQPVRPQSRMDTAPSRTQDEASRPTKTALSNASKAGVKRTIGNDTAEDRTKRLPSKGGPAYQSKDAKRRRTSQDHDEMEVDNPPNIKGPPVRPSAGFMKVSFRTPILTTKTYISRNCPRNLFTRVATLKRLLEPTCSRLQSPLSIRAR